MTTGTDPLPGTPEEYRQYLLTLARLQTDDRFNDKVDLSGVVQQTLLEAQAVADPWRTWSADQRIAWLRRALANNLTDEVRKFTADARDVDRERSLEQALADSSARLGAWLVAEQSSPSERAVRHEDLLRLASALAALPDDQQRAVELHHLKGLSLADTAAAMGKTTQAVVGLLFRGLRRLRELMA
ncbi:MAG TPA: sigma-70 family RNA polymerase sigma factor [Fimbriiglobus sp.]|nr:sigma-70 family RNA polymerase sigma factor [Fimbriiglobus sp.]